MPEQVPVSAWLTPARMEQLCAEDGLHPLTAALLLAYQQRIAALEQQVRSLQQVSHTVQLPREGPAPWREPHA